MGKHAVITPRLTANGMKTNQCREEAMFIMTEYPQRYRVCKWICIDCGLMTTAETGTKPKCKNRRNKKEGDYVQNI